eukprot:evm.model.scf_2612.2 EVM.evm.TU.scf_2612.2   scf_2612:17594-20865(-)
MRASAVPMPELQGALFRYGDKSAQVAFQSGSHGRHVVLVGGLTDGLLFAPYAEGLARALDGIGWSLVQAQLTSSYQGYGVQSLDDDADELHKLAMHLQTCKSSVGIVLVGHSTGCQDVVRFVQSYGSDKSMPPLLGTVLMAPISDQEELAMHPDLKLYEDKAKQMVADGQGNEILFRNYVTDDGTPTTARRFASLSSRGGDDDMFSSYFSSNELKKLLGHMSLCPCLIVMSGSDEFVPDYVDKQKLGQRFVESIGDSGAELVVVEGARHGMEGHEEKATGLLTQFIKEL